MERLDVFKPPEGAETSFGTGRKGALVCSSLILGLVFALGAFDLSACSGNGIMLTRSVSRFFFRAPYQWNTTA